MSCESCIYAHDLLSGTSVAPQLAAFVDLTSSEALCLRPTLGTYDEILGNRLRMMTPVVESESEDMAHAEEPSLVDLTFESKPSQAVDASRVSRGLD